MGLHAGRQTAFKTAYLVDPVDNSKYAPSGPEYPSAVEALQNVTKPIGMTGAGTVGRCNPPDANFQVGFIIVLAAIRGLAATSRHIEGAFVEHVH